MGIRASLLNQSQKSGDEIIKVYLSAQKLPGRFCEAVMRFIECIH